MIWVCTVCPDLSVRKLWIITVMALAFFTLIVRTDQNWVDMQAVISPCWAQGPKLKLLDFIMQFFLLRYFLSTCIT